MDEVNMSYCRRYAEGKEEKEEGYMGTQYDSSEDMAVDMVKKGLPEEKVEEVKRLRPKEYYQILDNGTGEWNDGFKYIGDIDGGSTVGEIGDHMFMAPTGPDAFIFVNISDAELDTMVRYDMNENKKPVEEAGQGTLMTVDRIEEIVNNLARNISTNSNIPTQEKIGLVQALKELKDLVEDLGADIEQEDEYVSDYSRRRAQELDEASDNPEGDALVLRFLKGIAKKFDYPVSQAALFVKERIKKLGY
jgi:hypothetical protein